MSYKSIVGKKRTLEEENTTKIPKNKVQKLSYGIMRPEDVTDKYNNLWLNNSIVLSTSDLLTALSLVQKLTQTKLFEEFLDNNRCGLCHGFYSNLILKHDPNQQGVRIQTNRLTHINYNTKELFGTRDYVIDSKELSSELKNFSDYVYCSSESDNLIQYKIQYIMITANFEGWSLKDRDTIIINCNLSDEKSTLFLEGAIDTCSGIYESTRQICVFDSKCNDKYSINSTIETLSDRSDNLKKITLLLVCNEGTGKHVHLKDTNESKQWNLEHYSDLYSDELISLILSFVSNLN